MPRHSWYMKFCGAAGGRVSRGWASGWAREGGSFPSSATHLNERLRQRVGRPAAGEVHELLEVGVEVLEDLRSRDGPVRGGKAPKRPSQLSRRTR